MNLTTLIKQYFHSSSNDVTIDVFDEKNIYSVYQRVVSVLTQYIDIETTVLQAMSYCFMSVVRFIYCFLQFLQKYVNN